MQNIKTYCLACLASAIIVNPASAHFYIDYQGTDVAYEKAKSKVRQLNGFSLLTENLGIVYEIGKSKPTKTYAFGDSLKFQAAMESIIPSTWPIYIEDGLDLERPISFNANNDTWTRVLESVGINHGYRFIVDWDQRLVQVMGEKDFVEPNAENVSSLQNLTNNETIYIYTSKPIKRKGALLINNKLQKIKIVD